MRDATPDRRRILPPAALTGVGVYLLMGCIPLPGNHRPPGGQPCYEEVVGPAGSDRPVRVGEATPEAVVAALGAWPPGRTVERAGDSYLLVRTDDAMLYTHAVVTRRTVLPLCGRIEDGYYEPRYLALTFGADRRLKRFSIHKSERDARLAIELAEPAHGPG